MTNNYLKLQFYSLPRNQAFARDAVAAFCLELNPTLSALSDVKTAVIDDVNQAVQPFFTSAPTDERSGMGFTIMQTFMDEFKVSSEKDKGTVVCMSKTFNAEVENA